MLAGISADCPLSLASPCSAASVSASCRADDVVEPREQLARGPTMVRNGFSSSKLSSGGGPGGGGGCHVAASSGPLDAASPAAGLEAAGRAAEASEADEGPPAGTRAAALPKARPETATSVADRCAAGHESIRALVRKAAGDSRYWSIFPLLSGVTLSTDTQSSTVRLASFQRTASVADSHVSSRFKQPAQVWLCPSAKQEAFGHPPTCLGRIRLRLSRLRLWCRFIFSTAIVARAGCAAIAPVAALVSAGCAAAWSELASNDFQRCQVAQVHCCCIAPCFLTPLDLQRT